MFSDLSGEAKPDPFCTLRLLSVGVRPGRVSRVLRYTIVCFEPDQERAVAIIDEALTKQRD